MKFLTSKISRGSSLLRESIGQQLAGIITSNALIEVHKLKCRNYFRGKRYRGTCNAIAFQMTQFIIPVPRTHTYLIPTEKYHIRFLDELAKDTMSTYFNKNAASLSLLRVSSVNFIKATAFGCIKIENFVDDEKSAFIQSREFHEFQL